MNSPLSLSLCLSHEEHVMERELVFHVECCFGSYCSSGYELSFPNPIFTRRASGMRSFVAAKRFDVNNDGFLLQKLLSSSIPPDQRNQQSYPKTDLVGNKIEVAIYRNDDEKCGISIADVASSGATSF